MDFFNYLFIKNKYEFIPVEINNYSSLTGIICKEKENLSRKNNISLEFPKRKIDFNRDDNIHSMEFWDRKDCINKLNIIIPSFKDINDFIKSVKIYHNDILLYDISNDIFMNKYLFRNKSMIIDNKKFIVLKMALLVKNDSKKNMIFKFVIEYNGLYKEYINQVTYTRKYICFE
jgi:hypothetical protein